MREGRQKPGDGPTKTLFAGYFKVDFEGVKCVIEDALAEDPDTLVSALRERLREEQR